MMTQYHGIPELLFGVGVLILGVVLAWGLVRNKHRNRANDPITDAATREQYQHPNSYDPEKFRQKLGPKS